MTSLLESKVSKFLDSEIGRTPTANEIAQGIVSPWTLANVLVNLNAGQSVLSVDNTQSLQDAVDAVVANGGGTVSLKAGTYMVNNNIILSSGVRLVGVGSDATIIDFGGGAYQVQMIGSLGNEVISPFLQGLTVQNSSIDLVYANYVINLGTNDLTCRNGLSGLKIQNTTTANIYSSLMDACDTGLIGIDSTFFTLFSSNVTSSTISGGFSFENVSNSASIGCSADANIGGGFIFTNCSDFGLENFAVTGTIGIGVLFDGGGAGIGVSLGFVDLSSGDGISFINSAGNLQIAAANTISNNGGYGINITSGSSNILIATNTFNSNNSGAINNAGTGTLIRSNIGTPDN